MFFNHPYVCALSGVAASSEEIEDADGGLPDEWIKITIETRFLNPKWEAIQQVKQGLLQQTLSQIPEKDRESQIVNVAIQVEAQYAQLEAATEKFTLETEQVHISPPERDKGILRAINEIRAVLGLKAVEMIENPNEKEEEEPPPPPSEPPQNPETASA